MAIQVLDQNTIDKIAAGEVIERPSSVVKELVENAIDAHATAITVEIKDGGISFIRITDNGEGIKGEELPLAFLRHSTSKIRSVEDLLSVTSLGFRGEALSSIAAVSQIELITKTADNFTGYRYVIEGGEEKSIEEVGAPDGTTFIVRNLFYNTPVRRKFLKTAATEAGYINSLLEHLSLSHPDVSFRFINNNKNRLHTSGNMNLRDIIYNVYGRDIAKNLIEVEAQTQDIQITGYIGKPMLCRGNRLYENYYINGRYIKSGIVTKAIEEAYKGHIMPHNYPFTALHFTVNQEIMDVNVHPTKMELRFSKNEFVYRFVLDTLTQALSEKELIPQVSVASPKAEQMQSENVLHREKNNNTNAFSSAQFSQKQPVIQTGLTQEAIAGIKETDTGKSVSSSAQPSYAAVKTVAEDTVGYHAPALKPLPAADIPKQSEADNISGSKSVSDAAFKPKYQTNSYSERLPEPFEKKRSKEMAEHDAKVMQEVVQKERKEQPEQMSLFADKLLDTSNQNKYRIIGQLFDTYWLIEFEDKFYMMDQHAAHEKVLYERMMRRLKEKKMDSQLIVPPVILSLNLREEEVLTKNKEIFERIGYEIESFGGREYKVTALPASLPKMDYRQLFMELLDGLVEDSNAKTLEMITEKIASMSCKAAVKGNNTLSMQEAQELMAEMMQAENPYNCPHGRPTLIMMSKYDIERKFKRIL